MKPIISKRSRFKLKGFLAALERFSLDHCGNGEPLPGVSGDAVYFDTGNLAEAIAQEEGFEEIPDDSLARLELGLPLFGLFALFNGFDGFDCVDGQEVEVPYLVDEDEDDEPPVSRLRRSRKYLEAVENTTADECTCFGFVISLDGDKVQIDAMGMSDVSGECELQPMAEPNLLSDGMRRWLRSFLIPKRGGK
jgi:hypothetical protein